MVHGDDFTFTGDEEALKWVEELMSGWYEIKVRARLGPDDHDDKEATLLGRMVSMAGVGSFVRGESEVQGFSVGGFGLTRGLKDLDVARHEGGEQ